MAVRPFRPSDLDQLVALAVKAYPLDPQWLYRYPGHYAYPEAAAGYIRGRFETELKNIAEAAAASGAVTIMVLDAAPETPEGKILGLSIWKNPGWHLTKADPARNYIKFRPDPPQGFSRERNTAFISVLKAKQAELLDDIYGDEYLELGQLYVHPEHHGKGYGRAMVSWGLERAGREGMPVALFASPMGKRLYLKLGFRQVGVLRVCVEGDGDWSGEDGGRGVVYPIMVWRAGESLG
ncbi:MAG: hypothetical protein MMC23_004141 [Stictis urceolatum]|nr:hypothetical protein [Stictis urceolata]